MGHDEDSMEITSLPDTPSEAHWQQREAEHASRSKPARKFGEGWREEPTLFDLDEPGTEGKK